jgi:hypothetical protein
LLVLSLCYAAAKRGFLRYAQAFHKIPTEKKRKRKIFFGFVLQKIPQASSDDGLNIE